MPQQTAESLLALDGVPAAETQQAELCLWRVAQRLNRLALQRALFRSLAAVLLAASAAAALATVLSPVGFRAALAALAVAVLGVVVLSARALRRRWAGELEAARWVERAVPLQQRLLTLVSARSRESGSRLWPELVADNRGQLEHWRDERLGIAAVPANVLLLLAALVVAWLFLVPWYTERPALPEMPGGAAAPQGEPAAGEGTGEGARALLAPQAVLEGGRTANERGSGPRVEVEGVAGASLDRLQADLAKSFERSLGGSAVLRQRSRPAPGDGEQPVTERGAVAESGLGKSRGDEGGVVPDEDLARREQDDGTGQTVRHRAGEASDGGTAMRAGTGERGRQADGDPSKQATGGAEGGRVAKGGDAPADGPLALGTEDGKKSHSGGAGAGSGKATEALLAKQPLTLSGGRHAARFALMLGGASGSAGSEGPKAMIAKPRGRIADGQRSEQAAERPVRHEEIPAEYEAAVKRIFKRD